MSERKGQGNRGSLMELSKPRLAQTPLSTPIDEAERLILSGEPKPTAPVAEQPTANSEAAPPGPVLAPALPHPPAAETRQPRQPEPTPPAASADDVVARLRKTRQPIAVVGFKLPAKLKEELAAVAQHNGTDMTRIVVEALERFLRDLPHPPGWRR
jgi:hypothetical protein